MKVLFRRQVYSNSSTGLEKSAQGVWNSLPSPIFGTLVPLLKVSWEKKFLPSKKSFLEDGVNYKPKLQSDKGIEDRVTILENLSRLG